MKRNIIVIVLGLGFCLSLTQCAPKSGKVSRKKYKWSYNNTARTTQQQQLV
ncbi:MAG: hypothetical protein Q8M29_07555 [Bacteroidota bacterium]|nr:hypothetical protein [Bacteroidota bacterium]